MANYIIEHSPILTLIGCSIFFAISMLSMLAFVEKKDKTNKNPPKLTLTFL